ncbi:MAG TPA: alpha/beta fold hydrolase [Acidimicrobiales bacterium]|nr:alpha/beta fold hydrolase [Acidimicrobiales bacterium]
MRSPLPVLRVGAGRPLLIVHGYGLPPSIYRPTAHLLGRSGWRVVVPDLFAVRGRWDYHRCVDAVAASMRASTSVPVTAVAHSFGGGILLGVATRHPELVERLVFCDTLGLSREWVLAREALHPTTLVRMATARAALGFGRMWASHPAALVRAAWWGFTSDRRDEVAAVRRRGLATHVLWADRDTLLPRSEGENFARDLGATFTVVERRPGSGPVDHDWMYRHPHLFASTLRRTIG